MNTRPHYKILAIVIVGLSMIRNSTDRWRIGFEVSQRSAACQIRNVSLLDIATRYDRRAEHFDRS